MIFRKMRPGLSKLLCLLISLCLFGQSLVFAAPEAIKVNVGNQTFQVTPGQWITVNQGSRILRYNVRYVNERPVALNESQYYQLIFGNPKQNTHQSAAPSVAFSEDKPVEKTLAAKLSETTRGVLSNLPTEWLNPAPSAPSAIPAVKPVPFASTDEGKIQKSSIRAGVTVASKILTGKTGAPKPQTNGLTPVSQENTPISKVDVGLGKATSKIKSGLDPKNILLKAGISVGVELATQIVRGEKPSAKKALAVVTSAEFAGNVVGSALGSAAGSFVVPFLAGVPVIGGVLSALAPTFGAIAGGSYGAYLAGDMKNGKFSLQDAFKKVNWVDVTGRSIGATVGGFLGATLFPPFGMFIGGIIGGTVGAIVAKKLWGIFGGKTDSAVANQSISVPGSNISSSLAPDGTSITIGAGENTAVVSSPPPSLSPTSESFVPGAMAPSGTQDSALTEAFSKYQELYYLYKEKIAGSSQEEILKIGQKMNQAKTEYERLKISFAQ